MAVSKSGQTWLDKTLNLQINSTLHWPNELCWLMSYTKKDITVLYRNQWFNVHLLATQAKLLFFSYSVGELQ